MRKYGRYCVNNRRSSIIIENNLQVPVMVMVVAVMVVKLKTATPRILTTTFDCFFAVVWNFHHFRAVPSSQNLSTFQLFSLYQFQQGFPLRVDAQLIKPIQRLTRFLPTMITLFCCCCCCCCEPQSVIRLVGKGVNEGSNPSGDWRSSSHPPNPPSTPY